MQKHPRTFVARVFAYRPSNIWMSLSFLLWYMIRVAMRRKKDVLHMPTKNLSPVRRAATQKTADKAISSFMVLVVNSRHLLAEKAINTNVVTATNSHNQVTPYTMKVVVPYFMIVSNIIWVTSGHKNN